MLSKIVQHIVRQSYLIQDRGNDAYKYTIFKTKVSSDIISVLSPHEKKIFRKWTKYKTTEEMIHEMRRRLKRGSIIYMTDTDIASLDNQYTNDIKKLFTNSHEEELIIKYDKDEYMHITAKKLSGHAS